MFLLHETTQRRVCRVLFLIACVIPTLLTIGWTAYAYRPWRQADWQRGFAHQLHVRATLDEIATPKPGLTSLANLSFADLRTGALLGSLPQLTIQQKDSRTLLATDHLELPATQLPALVTAISTWLANEEPTAIEFRAQQLTITNPQLQTVMLQNLIISSGPEDSSPQRFHLQATTDASEQLKLVVEHQGGNLRCKLDTRTASLPAWLVGQIASNVRSFGEAQFTGIVTAESQHDGTFGQLQGTFQGLDLQQWIGSAHRVQGQCQVQLKQLRWTDSAIDVARGSITAEAGSASYSMFVALADPKLFQCGVGSGWKTLAPSSTEEMIDFQQIGFNFQLTSSGISLRGTCAEQSLVQASSGPLLLSPPQEARIPVASLMQLLHLPEQGWLPYSRAALERANGLPLPGKQKDRDATIKK